MAGVKMLELRCLKRCRSIITDAPVVFQVEAWTVTAQHLKGGSSHPHVDPSSTCHIGSYIIYRVLVSQWFLTLVIQAENLFCTFFTFELLVRLLLGLHCCRT